MPNFRPLGDNEIHALDDEQILAYALSARDAGRPADAARALQILAWGYRDIVRSRVVRRVPTEVAEDVADAAILRAVAQVLKAGAFKGTSQGEFRKWLHTIVDRQVVDFFRARERRVSETALPEEHAGEEDAPQATAAVTDDGTGAVEVQALIDQALAEVNADHREVVELYVFGRWTAAETAERVGGGMTENNVHQIGHRFRERMRELLEDD